MKKILLTLAILLINVAAFCQLKAAAVTLTIGVRDYEFQEFEWGETRVIEEIIPIIIDGKDITIYTEDVQYYQTLMPEYETNDGNGSFWYAYDVNMKKCKFYMYNDGANFIMIEYNDVCIIYGIIYRN
jgi:hypothetical protein